MLRGLYTAAAGMLATNIATDTLASNLANVSTVGFKANKVNFQTFPEMLINRISNQQTQRVGSLVTGSQIYESFINFSAGSMRQTGNTFDMAIQGDGFFTVKAPNGSTYYTRAGNFTMNEQGFLTTSEGDYVQGSLGNIQLALDGGPYQITAQGEVSGRAGLIDQLKVTRFKDQHALQKVSDSLYQAPPSAQVETLPAGAALPYKVLSGSLEDSNVNPVAELVNNIQGLRLYEALQKNIHIHNDTLGKAVNDVGRPH